MPDTLRKAIAKYRLDGESQASTVHRLVLVNGQLFDRIEELEADVAKWRLEVEATANRGVAVVGEVEAQSRAINHGVALRLGEHRMARDAAERALRAAEGQIATVHKELDAARHDRDNYHAWWQAAQRAVMGGVDELAAVRAELDTAAIRRAEIQQERDNARAELDTTAEMLLKQVEITEAAEAARKADTEALARAINADRLTIEERDRAVAINHAAALSSAASSARLIGAILGGAAVLVLAAFVALVLG